MVRQEERRAATLGAILAAAERLFGDNGYEATSVDEIAASAGVAKGAVYHHFQRKQDVFEAVFERVSSRLVLAVAGDVQPDLVIIDQLVASTPPIFPAMRRSHGRSHHPAGRAPRCSGMNGGANLTKRISGAR